MSKQSYHGCFSGDCPHLNKGVDCLKVIEEHCASLEASEAIFIEALKFYADIKPWLNSKHGDIRRKARKALKKHEEAINAEV